MSWFIGTLVHIVADILQRCSVEKLIYWMTKYIVSRKRNSSISCSWRFICNSWILNFNTIILFHRSVFRNITWNDFLFFLFSVVSFPKKLLSFQKLQPQVVVAVRTHCNSKTMQILHVYWKLKSETECCRQGMSQFIQQCFTFAPARLKNCVNLCLML